MNYSIDEKVINMPAESILRYSALFEQASDAIMFTDMRGYFIDANESFCKMLGYKKEEILLHNIKDILDKEDLDAQPLRFSLLEEGQQIFSVRKMKRKDGTFFYVETNAKKCAENTVLAIARDITERLNTETALEKEKALSDSIINMLPGIFFLRYNPGNYIRWNNNLEQLIGYSKEQLLNSPILGFIAEEDRVRLSQKVKQAMEKGHAEGEACIIDKNGNRIPYYFSAVSLILDGKPALMGTGIDISQRIKAQKQLEQIKSEKQKEITEAMITAAENERQSIGRELHDNINQLLAGSLMYLRLFQANLDKPDPLLEEASVQVINAISEIRNLSHSIISPFVQEQPFGEALDKIKIILNNSGISDIKIDIGKLKEKQISYKLKIAMFRIIQEQFNNIMKHSEADKVEVKIIQNRSAIQLIIKDNGKGFNPSRISNGIGLLNIKTRASMFKGEVKINSSPGNGCELVVSIPATPLKTQK